MTESNPLGKSLAMPTIPSSALVQLSESDRDKLLGSLFVSDPETVAGYLAVIDARLRVFEQRYEIPTGGVPAAIGAGRLADTADVSQWLFWMDVRGRIAEQTRPNPA